MRDKPLVALEIHDVSLWEPTKVLPIVDRMEHWGYNALVLHENDLLDACTQLGLTANYGVSDLRLKKVRNNTAWLNRLVDRLDRFGAELFLEIKEPSFHDYALEHFPELLGADGRPDPRHEPWARFCEAKTRDLLKRAPGIGGFIVNLSSPESRVSLPDFLATHGRALDKRAWFAEMISAFFNPLQEVGKALFVRDFSYTSDMQSDVLSAIDAFGGAVGASVKITAHDYFPEYPENPVARGVAVPMILEFEAFGEHTGWGAIPNCRVGEFRERMKGYREMGACGFLMRTSWEAMRGANAMEALSAVNVYALPHLIAEDRDANALVMAWLDDAFGLTGGLATRVSGLLLKSWSVPAGAYWHGQVFPRHSCLPSSWQEGWLSMATNGMGRRDRDLELSKADPRLSDAACEKLFQEKEQTTELATALSHEAQEIAGALPEALGAMWETFAHLPYFARQFELATKATFFAARYEAGCASSDDVQVLVELKAQLTELAHEIAEYWEGAGDVPHHHRILLDPDQIGIFAASLPDEAGFDKPSDLG